MDELHCGNDCCIGCTVLVWPFDSNTADGPVARFRQSRFVAHREEFVANNGRELPDRQAHCHTAVWRKCFAVI